MRLQRKTSITNTLFITTCILGAMFAARAGDLKRASAAQSVARFPQTAELTIDTTPGFHPAVAHFANYFAHNYDWERDVAPTALSLLDHHMPIVLRDIVMQYVGSVPLVDVMKDHPGLPERLNVYATKLAAGTIYSTVRMTITSRLHFPRTVSTSNLSFSGEPYISLRDLAPKALCDRYGAISIDAREPATPIPQDPEVLVSAIRIIEACSLSNDNGVRITFKTGIRQLPVHMQTIAQAAKQWRDLAVAINKLHCTLDWRHEFAGDPHNSVDALLGPKRIIQAPCEPGGWRNEFDAEEFRASDDLDRHD